MVSEFVHMNIKQECMDELEHELIPNIESSTISKDAPNSELDFEDKRESEESEQGLNIQREHVEPQVKDELSTTAETKAPGMSRNYYCVDCKSSTRNPRLYLQHRRDFHKESISIHECELCMYASKHSQKLARHFRTVHRDVFQSMAAQPGPSTNFISASEMIPDALQTVQAAKKTRLSTCRVCGLFAVSKTVLMDHIRSVHPELRIYECDQCEYSHYIRDRYNRHHRYHSMNHIRCQMCEFQTIYRWNLERHMRHHIDTISLGFRCNKCNFTASTKQSITAHEIAHHSGLNNQIDTFQLSNLPIDQTTVEKTERHSDEGNDTRMEEEGDFNASDFLNVVLADEKETSERLGSIDEKQEMRADLTEQRTKNEMKFFYCKNCNFRNEIEWHGSVKDQPLLLSAPFKNERSFSSSQYRCGFCHQKSNWKHVIERHCRLVHNMPAFIEKYSSEEHTFQNFTAIKRRSDSSEAIDLSTKRVPPIDTKPPHELKSFPNVIAFPQIFN